MPDRLTLPEVVDLQAYRRERSHRSLVSTVQATMRCSEAEAEWFLRLIIDRAEDKSKTAGARRSGEPGSPVS